MRLPAIFPSLDGKAHPTKREEKRDHTRHCGLGFARRFCTSPHLAGRGKARIVGCRPSPLFSVQRVSGDSVGWVRRLGAQASNCRHRLLLICLTFPKIVSSRRNVNRFFHGLPRAIVGKSLSVDTLRRVPMNLEARVTFRFGTAVYPASYCLWCRSLALSDAVHSMVAWLHALKGQT